MQIQKRSLGMYIVLSIITCGLFSIYWFIVATDDLKIAANDYEGSTGGVAYLLTVITCGIYGYFWAYKMGERLDIAKSMRGMPTGSSNILFLILQIFGLMIVNLALIQDSLNKFADMGNGMGNGPMGNGPMGNGPMYNGPMNNGPMN